MTREPPRNRKLKIIKGKKPQQKKELKKINKKKYI